mgnify:CR=1 FL=1
MFKKKSLIESLVNIGPKTKTLTIKTKNKAGKILKILDIIK